MGRGTRYYHGLETVGSSITVGDDLTVADDATVTGTFNQSGAYSTTEDFAVNTNKFTVAAATGNTAVAGTLDVTGAADFAGGVTFDTNALAVANTTGVLTLKNGATIDNNASATVLNLTETTVRVTGALDVTGGFTTDTNAFAIADTTGIITMKDGATIDNDTGTTTLTVTSTTITLVGTVGVTGALDVTGGLTTDTNAFAIADTTGIVTMINGATLDNNTSATVLNITETTVRITGGLDVTAGFTTDSTAFAIADTTGVVTMKGGATIDNNADAAILNLTETTVRVTGILDVTGNSTQASVDVGGGFTTGTGSGLTVAATGALSTNGAIIGESSITSGNNGANGHAGTITVNDGANPGAASFVVAGSTGIITLHEGATIDNDTGTNTLTLTETTISLAGAVDVTGAFTVATNKLSVASATGIITMNEGATIDNDTGTNTLTLTETTITLVGTVGVTGALDVTGGFTTDTNAFAVADTTGVLTLKGGATIDNNADAAILNLTETTVRVTGILDVTGNSTLASLDVGGGSGGSGATITAAGAATFDGAVVCSSTVGITGALTTAAQARTSEGVGAIVANKATVVEYGAGGIHQSAFTFTMTGADDIDVADGDKSTGVKFYDFPEGRILILGATINAVDTFTNMSGNYYVGVGTADGTQAADADLTGTEQDIIPKTTIDGSQASPLDVHAALTASAQFDGTGTAKDLYINIACPDASHTGSAHAITGTCTVTWINLGDY